MIKYTTSKVVFEEIPDKVTLAINISNCQNRCKGCHSSELLLNIGKELTQSEIDSLIIKNSGINCICLMGEGNDQLALVKLLKYVKDKYPEISLGLYSGRDNVENEILTWVDYIKVGGYNQDLGPLNSKTTNQRLYHYNKNERNNKLLFPKEWDDITYRFWSKKR